MKSIEKRDISMQSKLYMCGFLLLSILPSAFAVCVSPELPVDVYALTPSSSSFITGALFDIVCVPGNGPDTVIQLRCDGGGEWHGQWPDCSKHESKAKWWMFLLGMVGVVVLIPCILPRLYFTFLDTSSPRKGLLINKRRRTTRNANDKIRMQTFSNESVRVPSGEETIPDYNMHPTPLPPIKRQSDRSSNN